MSRYWSAVVHGLTPYVPGEQPKLPDLVKLNTNENPYGPSPKVLEALRAEAADTLRLYPDPSGERLKQAIAACHGVKAEQVFVGNGSDEVLGHTFLALLKHDLPLLFPDITYSFYPVYCGLYGIESRQVPLTEAFEIRIDDYIGQPNGGIIFPNPNAPTGRLLALAEIERLLQANGDSVVVVDEAYVDFGGESAVTLVDRYPQLLVIHTLSKSRSLAGLRVGYAVGHRDFDRGARPGQRQLQFLPAGSFRPGRRRGGDGGPGLVRRNPPQGDRQSHPFGGGTGRDGVRGAAFCRQFHIRASSALRRRGADRQTARAQHHRAPFQESSAHRAVPAHHHRHRCAMRRAGRGAAGDSRLTAMATGALSPCHLGLE